MSLLSDAYFNPERYKVVHVPEYTKEDIQAIISHFIEFEIDAEERDKSKSAIVTLKITSEDVFSTHNIFFDNNQKRFGGKFTEDWTLEAFRFLQLKWNAGKTSKVVYIMPNHIYRGMELDGPRVIRTIVLKDKEKHKPQKRIYFLPAGLGSKPRPLYYINPITLAHQFANVQPLSAPSGKIFTFKTRYGIIKPQPIVITV